jgi:hypothetical protein
MAPEKNNRRMVAETENDQRLILAETFTDMIENVKIIFVTHTALLNLDVYWNSINLLV